MNSSKPFNLIVPAAADAKGSGSLPAVFRLDADGVMLCVRAIQGLNLDVFDRISFVVLRKHVEDFDIDTMLRLQFKRLGLHKANIVVLAESTDCQPATVRRAIEQLGIDGPFFVKDADSYFQADVYAENSVAVYPLEELEIVDPRNKSYVSVADMQYVTNIIEKKVVSNLFSAGGYGFVDVETFNRVFDRYISLGPVYLSHLIYALLLEGESFHPIKVSDYQDLLLN